MRWKLIGGLAVVESNQSGDWIKFLAQRFHFAGCFDFFRCSNIEPGHGIGRFIRQPCSKPKRDHRGDHDSYRRNR